MHPLGLATKGTAWYLVAHTDAGLRTFRVDRMTSIEPTGERVVRPVGFDLAEAWKLITEQVEERRSPLRARALVQPTMVWECRHVFGSRVRIGPTIADGRVEVELRAGGASTLAAEIAGFGSALEVLDPPEVRVHLARIATELASTYGAMAAGPTISG